MSSLSESESSGLHCVAVVDGSAGWSERVREAVSANFESATVLSFDGADAPRDGGAEPITVDLDDRDAVAREFDRISTERPIDVVVVAVTPSLSVEPSEIVNSDFERWDATCEQPLRVAGHVTEAAFAHLDHSSGTMIWICPSIGLQGGAGFVSLAAASEGQRILAKSAARQWAKDDIRVNIVAPPLSGLLAAERRDDELAADGLRGRNASGDTFDLDAGLAAAIELLSSRAGRFLVGATLTIDGGQVTVL